MRARLSLAAVSGTLLVPAIGFSLASAFKPESTFRRTQQAPTWSFAENAPFYTVDRRGCLSLPVGPSAVSECGSLRITHPLPAVRTFNTRKTPTLIYNSEFAHPYAVLPLRITISSSTTTPDSVEVKVFEYNYSDWSSIPRGTFRWGGSEWSSGQTTTRQISIALDRGSDTTCYCIFTAQVSNIYGGVPVTQPSVNTWGIFIVNRRPSPFGAGWWLAGLEKLLHTGPANQKVWFAGDGSARFFLPLQTQTSDTVWASAMYDKVDTLYRTGSFPNVVWTKTNSEGVRTTFDQLGNHRTTVDRFGRTTTFHYTGGVLDSITLPPTNQRYKFTYSGGTLASVTAPPIGSTTRVTTVTGASGRITQIRNPGDSVVTFGYYTAAPDADLMSTRVNRRNVADSFFYDGARRIQTSRLKMSGGAADIAWSLVHGHTRGLPNSGSPSSVDTAKVYTRIDGPRTNVADTTVVRQIQFAAPSAVTNALNEPPTKFLYGCGGQTAQYPCNWVPMRGQYPSGRVMLAEYNWVRGNLLRVIDSVTPVAGQRDTTRYEWDGKFDQLTRIIPPEKDSTVFSVSTTNGNRLWQQPGADASRRLTFDYYPSGSAAAMLRGVGFPGGARDSIEYSAVANTSGVRTPLGQWTRFDSDPVGRDTVISRDITIGGGTRQVDTVTLDLRDEVVSTKSFGPALNGASAQSVRTATTYDPEGNVLTVQRWSLPDTAGIGTITTTWRYDNANRAVAEVAPDGLKDSTIFDPPGNPLATITRRGHRLGRAFDVLNRRTSDTIPSVNYPASTAGIAGRAGQPPYQYTVSGDTATYAYDVMGNLVAANNRDAKVKRIYNVKGELERDSLRIRDASGTVFTNHRYGIANTYDRNGRRVRLRIPTQLGVNGADSIRFAYDPVLGAPKQVYDILNNQFRYAYNLRIELDSIIRPGNLAQRFVYDNDGRIQVDSIKNMGVAAYPRHPSAVLRATTYTYDARALVAQATDPTSFKDTLQVSYSGLGHAVKTSLVQNGSWLGTGFPGRYRSIDTLRYDAIGNITRAFAIDSAFTEGAWKASSRPRNRPAYQAGTGRQLTDTLSNGKRFFTHDSSGNIRFTTVVQNPQNARMEDRAAYYRADQRLAASDWRYVTDGSVIPGKPEERQFVENRYDALGRRVWQRVQPTCAPDSSVPNFARMVCQLTFIKRFVWDGDQELVEIQMPLASIVPANPIENDTTTTKVAKYVDALGNPVADPNPFYGRVVYVPGLTLDRPITLTRIGYADWPAQGPSDTTYKGNWGPFTLAPFWNSRGVAPDGAFADGDRYKQVGATNCVPISATARCISLPWTIDWSAYDRSKKLILLTGWHGSVVEDKGDKGGLNFRRNRYYDPASGRFTQEDPLGLAGGLNLYGFAGGDPVNFGDPFGLCPVCLIAWGIYEVGSGIFDVYSAIKTASDPNASTGQKFATVGLAAAGVLLPGGGYSAGGKLAGRLGSTVEEVSRRVANISGRLDRLHLSTARLENTGRLVTGFDHVQEVTDYANGLRNQIRRLNGVLGDPNLDAATRRAAEQTLGRASRSLDAAERALRP
ncbi:MAG: RHS repeat-associated core domain-containing protein [Gemmatimonadales bacterium]